MRRSRTSLLALVVLAGLLTVTQAESQEKAQEKAQEAVPPRDPLTEHLATGFPLEGAHELIRCESCHVRGIFAGTPRMCSGCHENGSGFIDADTKPPDHIPTRAECELCHDQRTWHGAIFEHESETDGRCSSCHNNVTAPGKPPDHIPTTSQCDACHGTLGFAQAVFEHSAVTGSCSSCHQGLMAEAKPPSHFVTSLPCDTCHETDRWKRIDFEHSSSRYPGNHRSSVDCVACHQGNSASVSWPAPSFQGDCAGCHANDFEKDRHEKSESPKVYYSVSELRDCTGSCHVYADSTFEEIRRSRSREHRVGAGEF
jgi:hypothetical protein